MPNELIFTTGLSYGREPDWLLHFLQALIDAGTTGVVLNVGKYIFPDQITAEAKALCNSHDFPLFIMPWHIRLADVTQAFLSSLFLTKQTEYTVVHACKNLLFTPDQRDQAAQTLRLQGFAAEGQYQVVVAAEAELPEGQLTRYKGFFNDQLKQYILFPIATGYVLVWDNSQNVDISALLGHLTALGAADTAQYGIGMAVPTLRDLPTSYTQAAQALAWAAYRRQPCQYFQDLGVYALLCSQQNDLAMRHLHDTYLGPLLTYDGEHHRNLYDTLESFLRHDGSLQAVAAETFSHRNTVLYRMKKIKALLQCDFADGESRFPYQLACYIHRYLEVMSGK